MGRWLASPRSSRKGLRKEGTMWRAIKSRIRLPPLPSSRLTVFSSVVVILPVFLPAVILVIDEAGAFKGDHDRPERGVRPALPAEERALRRRDQAAQGFPAAAPGAGPGSLL